MSGHHPFAELTKDLTAERRQRVAKMRASLERASLFHVSPVEKQRRRKVSIPLGAFRRPIRTSRTREKARSRPSVRRAIPGIESTRGVCGGEPCIVRTRIPVWVLERARRSGASDAELLSDYPTLQLDDLTNAWVYVRSHWQVIDNQIRENKDA